MILEAAGAAFVRLFSAEFRRLFLKSLGLTLLILVVLWIALERLVSTLALPWIGALLPGSGGWDSMVRADRRHPRRACSGARPGAADWAGDGDRRRFFPR